MYYVCQTDNLGTRVALLINVERIDAVSGNGVLWLVESEVCHANRSVLYPELYDTDRSSPHRCSSSIQRHEILYFSLSLSFLAASIWIFLWKFNYKLSILTKLWTEKPTSIRVTHHVSNSVKKPHQNLLWIFYLAFRFLVSVLDF